MRTNNCLSEFDNNLIQQQMFYNTENIMTSKLEHKQIENIIKKNCTENKAGVLFVTSYPPRECGIATYSQDLILALNNKFSNSLSIKVCALESNGTTYPYFSGVKYILKTSLASSYENIASKINKDDQINIVIIQHEFGFFKLQERAFMQFLYEVTKPVVIVFHTVLPHPDEKLKLKVFGIAAACESIIVMTNTSSDILYHI